jgi:hypothetical protein
MIKIPPNKNSIEKRALEEYKIICTDNKIQYTHDFDAEYVAFDWVDLTCKSCFYTLGYNVQTNVFDTDDILDCPEIAFLLEKRPLKRFKLLRKEDESGVSGTGYVAEGIQFSNGKCILSWLTRVTSLGVYDTVEQLEHIHGHGGKTIVEWID